MIYNKFSYIFPPRPKNAANPVDIIKYDNGSLMGQIKSNGSNSLIFTNGREFHVYNRHGEKLTNFKLDKEEILDNLYNLSDNKWLCINSEYLNKNKNDETGNSFNHKLLIFDILVYDSDYLLGRSFLDRDKLLDDLYGKEECEKEYLYKISENIYRVKTYETGFSELYNKYSKIDLIEGLVLKRKTGKLEIGTEPCKSMMVKFRKPTKNYQC